MLFATDGEKVIGLYPEHERAMQSKPDALRDCDTVPIRGSSIGQLVILYPNYFGDISGFLELADKYPSVFR